MTDRNIIKCTIDKGKIEVCNALYRAADGNKLRKQTIVIFDTGKFLREQIVLYTGDNKKNGVVFNFCPFCSQKLHNLFDEQPTQQDTTEG